MAGQPLGLAQRLPVVGVALAGFAIATYLTLFQLGVLTSVLEPFFGDGSRTVLTSGISRLLPVPDAALGVAGYLLDAVSGRSAAPGGGGRMPWIVIVFGVAVGPLGVTSVLLVIAQPVLYHAFCTLCLASAVISVAMIAPAVDQVLASLQHLGRVQLAGGSVWRAFWGRGGPGRGRPPRLRRAPHMGGAVAGGHRPVAAPARRHRSSGHRVSSQSMPPIGRRTARRTEEAHRATSTVTTPNTQALVAPSETSV